MAQDISNKSLAIMLALSIVISLGGMIVFLTKGGDELTGAATQTVAIAKINITSRASINWTVYTVDWGTGAVNDTATYCMLNTEGLNDVANCSGFTPVYQGLRMENDGNRVVQLNLSSNVSAAQFIGGTNPLFQWKMANNESDSCGNQQPGNTCSLNSTALQYQGAYYDVSTTPVEVCPCYKFQNENDTINVELQVKVPQDSYYGEREATITAVATVV